jgi:hypothetical protein
MSARDKFLGVALWIVSMFVVYRITPGGAALMAVALLALAHYVCNNTRRP